MRQKIYDAISDIAQVTQLAVLREPITHPVIIIRKRSGVKSFWNSNGHWMYWDVICHVPDTESMIILDEIMELVKERMLALGDDIVDSISDSDYYNDISRSYYNRVTIRVPETVLKK